MTEVVQRIQILDRPLLSPSCCIICGATSDDRKYIDFGQYIDYYGTVYFCETCFSEVALSVGWLSPIKALEIKVEFQKLQNDYMVAEKEVKAQRVRIEALNEVLRGTVSNSDSNDTLRDVSDFEDVSQSSERTSPETESPNSISDGDSINEGSKRTNNSASPKRSSSAKAPTKSLKF